VLATSLAAGTVAERFLTATTPGSSGVAEAYTAVSAAYERADTPIMRNYLDAYYVRNPAQSFIYTDSIFALNWRDYNATVLAFVKPDDTPGTADGAQASGAIRVTFRDWVYPWIITHYLPPPEIRVNEYRDRFRLQLGNGYEAAVKGMYEVVNQRSLDRGLIGMQQELAAARQAVATLPTADAPAFLGNLVQTVGGGLQVQQRLAYSQAVTPLAGQDAGAGFAISIAGAQGEIAAGREIAVARADFGTMFSASEARVMDAVRGENERFANDLLREDGPVRLAENLARAASADVSKVSAELGNRASVELVSQILTARGGG
jgi:hypothetical protein